MFDKSFDMEKLPPLNEQSNISLNKNPMYPLFECEMHISIASDMRLHTTLIYDFNFTYTNNSITAEHNKNKLYFSQLSLFFLFFFLKEFFFFGILKSFHNKYPFSHI